MSKLGRFAAACAAVLCAFCAMASVQVAPGSVDDAKAINDAIAAAAADGGDGVVQLADGSRSTGEQNYRSEGGGGRLALGSRVSFALARKMAASGAYEGPGRAKNHVFGLDEFLVRYPGVAVDLADGRGNQTGECAGTFRYVDATPSGLMLIVR